MKEELVAEGPWSFEYTIKDSSNLRQTYEIYQTYDLGGNEIQINRLEISPLGYTLFVDYDSAMKVEEDERNKETYNGDDAGLTLDTRLAIRKIIFEDGTELNQADEVFTGRGAFGGTDKKELRVTESFIRVIDVEHIKSIYIMQGEVEIPL